jgi:hypothetical protein
MARTVERLHNDEYEAKSAAFIWLGNAALGATAAGIAISHEISKHAANTGNTTLAVIGGVIAVVGLGISAKNSAEATALRMEIERREYEESPQHPAPPGERGAAADDAGSTRIYPAVPIRDTELYP